MRCEEKGSDVAISLLKRYPNWINVRDESGTHALHIAVAELELLEYIFGNSNFDTLANLRMSYQGHGSRLHGSIQIVVKTALLIL